MVWGVTIVGVCGAWALRWSSSRWRRWTGARYWTASWRFPRNTGGRIWVRFQHRPIISTLLSNTNDAARIHFWPVAPLCVRFVFDAISLTDDYQWSRVIPLLCLHYLNELVNATVEERLLSLLPSVAPSFPFFHNCLQLNSQSINKLPIVRLTWYESVGKGEKVIAAEVVVVVNER